MNDQGWGSNAPEANNILATDSKNWLPNEAIKGNQRITFSSMTGIYSYAFEKKEQQC